MKIFPMIVAISGVTTLGLVTTQANVNAQTAARAAYAEVRANGSSVAASFEQTLPEGVFFEAAAIGDGPNLTVNTAGTAGTNQSDLQELGFLQTGTSTDLATIEAAIANLIENESTGTPPGTFEAEDIVGIIRSYVGPEGVGTPAEVTLD